LVRRGYDVTVICPRTPGAKNDVINGVHVRRLPRMNRLPGRRVSYLLSLAVFIATNCRRFDLVHIHLANLQTDVIVPIAMLLGRPVYAKVACGGAAGEVRRLAAPARVTRWFGLRHATRVQALSSEIVGEMHEIGVRPDRIVEIPNGIDLDSFTPATQAEKRELRRKLDLPVDDVILLFAGRFARYKGVADLLAIWPDVAGESSTLVLVGEADTDKPMGELPPHPRMIVRDFTNTVVDYLRAADVFVYPSFADGMSNAVLEAMACGLTIVASRSGATASMLRDEASALLFDAGDRAALSGALERVLGDEELRGRLSGGARDDVGRFAIGAVVDRIERVYADMVGPPLPD
jgi:glycosyltransferase involved in cell wall biosynthesis